jgi:hypothetical protein
VWVAAAVTIAIAGAAVLLQGQERSTTAQVVPEGEKIKMVPRHVAEVRAMLADLKVDEPRRYKNMVVFPIRWGGKQAGGDWSTMDIAAAAGELKVTEKGQATVPTVEMQNASNRTLLLMSGEIIKGGQQTRVIRRDTILDAQQRADVPVFCVEKSRWSGGKEFKNSTNMAPAALQEQIKRGADQTAVWGEVQKKSEAVGAKSATGSLDEVLDSSKVREEQNKARESLGHFSPPETIGVAFGDLRTGRVVGLELFGNRYLFANLQEKLIQGYTTELVVTAATVDEKELREDRVTRRDVEAFIERVAAGTSQYEETAGSGRGIDLSSGNLRGKGVAMGEVLIHLSVQDLQPAVTPAKPIVEPQPVPVPLPTPARPSVDDGPILRPVPPVPDPPEVRPMER